jgi:RecA-family ATPase
MSDLLDEAEAYIVPDRPPPPGPASDRLRPLSLEHLALVVEEAGPREWDVEPLIIRGQHGVIGSVMKAGKGFDVADLAVSKASGTPWLGRFACPVPGSVLVFAGEEDEREVHRRVTAVAAARGLEARELPIYYAFGVPRLSDPGDLEIVRRRLEEVGPQLSCIDPLYRAAAGADHRSLYARGDLRGRAEELTREFRTTLPVVTHFNRSREARGAERLTGAGPAEWGRFLISAEITKRQRTP